MVIVIKDYYTLLWQLVDDVWCDSVATLDFALLSTAVAMCPSFTAAAVRWRWVYECAKLSRQLDHSRPTGSSTASEMRGSSRLVSLTCYRSSRLRFHRPTVQYLYYTVCQRASACVDSLSDFSTSLSLSLSYCRSCLMPFVSWCHQTVTLADLEVNLHSHTHTRRLCCSETGLLDRASVQYSRTIKCTII